MPNTTSVNAEARKLVRAVYAKPLDEMNSEELFQHHRALDRARFTEAELTEIRTGDPRWAHFRRKRVIERHEKALALEEVAPTLRS